MSMGKPIVPANQAMTDTTLLNEDTNNQLCKKTTLEREKDLGANNLIIRHKTLEIN